MAHQGVLFASPEYNASITPLLKNAIDWVSTLREPGEPMMAAFKDRVFAVVSASPGRFGGTRSCLALRQVLEVGCRALVAPDQVSVPLAAHAFDEMDHLKDARLGDELRAFVRRLVALARQLA
jgi:NAD(P)H-dependent FMN reductase